jgi:hypothetical protein
MVMAWPGNVRAIHGALVSALEAGTLDRKRLEEAASRVIAEKLRYEMPFFHRLTYEVYETCVDASLSAVPHGASLLKTPPERSAAIAAAVQSGGMKCEYLRDYEGGE